jgi:hypothetical protein
MIFDSYWVNETNQIIKNENPTPCTFAIVPESITIMYRTYSNIISFLYNNNIVQYSIITSEATRNMI